MNTLGETIRRITAYLLERGVDSPSLSARLIAGAVLGLDASGMARESGRELTNSEAERIGELARRRGEGEPAAYILGEKEFYGLPMRVGPGVLVPRPETELLIDAAVKVFERDAKLVFADLGAGSGCVAIAAAHAFMNSTGIMVDKSPIALDTAMDNAKRNKVDGRLAPVLADFTMPFAKGESLDLIMANPPYVSDEEYMGLDREVLLYEPEEALRGGPEGVEISLAMMDAVAPALKPGGVFLMEIGAAQGERFRLILDDFESPFNKVEILNDLAGHDRAVFCYKSGNG